MFNSSAEEDTSCVCSVSRHRLRSLTLVAIVAIGSQACKPSPDDLYDSAMQIVNNLEQGAIDGEVNVALSRLETACGQEHQESCQILARLISRENRKVISVDRERAQSLARVACDGGAPPACGELAFSYYNQKPYPNIAAFLESATRACEGNDGLGCFMLGLAHEEDVVCEKDDDKSMSYYASSCSARFGAACHRLAKLELDRLDDPTQLDRILDLYGTGCAADHATSCVSLGLALHRGEGVERSSEDARTAFRRACILGKELGCQYLREEPWLTIPTRLSIIKADAVSYRDKPTLVYVSIRPTDYYNYGYSRARSSHYAFVMYDKVDGKSHESRLYGYLERSKGSAFFDAVAKDLPDNTREGVTATLIVSYLPRRWSPHSADHIEILSAELGRHSALLAKHEESVAVDLPSSPRGGQEQRGVRLASGCDEALARRVFRQYCLGGFGLSRFTGVRVRNDYPAYCDCVTAVVRLRDILEIAKDGCTLLNNVAFFKLLDANYLVQRCGLSGL